MRILCARTFGFSQVICQSSVTFTNHFIYVWTSKPASKRFRSPAVITIVPTNQAVLAHSPELLSGTSQYNSAWIALVPVFPQSYLAYHSSAICLLHVTIRSSSPVLILHNSVPGCCQQRQTMWALMLCVAAGLQRDPAASSASCGMSYDFSRGAKQLPFAV